VAVRKKPSSRKKQRLSAQAVKRAMESHASCRLSCPTDVADPAPPLPAPDRSQRKHKFFFWGALFFFVLCGLIWFMYWLIWGQFYESTEDAYVTGNMIMVTPQEWGIITSILVDNAQLVDAGQPILEIDRHDYEIALEGAKADLGDAVRKSTQMFIQVEQLKAKKEASKADLVRAVLDYEHRKALVSDASVSVEDFEHSETTLAAAWATYRETDKMLAGAAALVENTTVATHPIVEQAKASLKKAFLSLHRCTVLAPARGIITQRRAQVGQWVNASDPLMALVPLDQIWVDANFREVSLKNLRIGQPIEMHADMYGRGVHFHGKVVGLNPGTGAVFSILPPQNATGNWIKIIQRVPVKIGLELKEIEQYPLMLGLSTTVTVDTHDRSGDRLPGAAPVEAVYSTDVYEDELSGVDEMIDQIIADNSQYPAEPQS
jgi:membrane fusion protein (multidrug efflux system)